MQFSNILFTLLITSVVAKGNSTKAVTDKSLCKEMAKLEKVVSLAANSTKLAAKEKNNSTKIAEYTAKASTAATELATMQSNTTLVSTCAVISAAEDTEDDCSTMSQLEKIVALAANTTKLADKAKNNATKIAAYQTKASAAAVKLADMTSNTTLVDACTNITATKAAEKAEKKAEKATEDGTTTDATAASASSSAASASSTATSGSSILNAQTGMVSTMVLVALGMFML